MFLYLCAMNRFLILLVLIFLVGCGNSKQQLIDDAPLITQRYQDDLGREIKLSRTPTKIVSLAPSCTEMLFALGAGKQIAARSQACDYPIDALDLPEIITYPSLDLPAIAELDPDLVLATTEIFDVKQADFFDRYDIPLFFQDFEGVDDIYRNLNSLGQMLDRKQAAEELVAELKSNEKMIVDSTKTKVKYPTMVLIAVKPLIVAGAGSFISEVIEKAGGKNAFDDISDKYPVVNQEAVLNANPEVILIPSTNEQIYQDFAEAYPLLHLNMIASQDGRVYLIDPNLVLRPGPRTVEGMAFLAKTLHPNIDLTEIIE